MTDRNPYEINYARLEKLMGQPLDSLSEERAYRLRSDQGFMDLVVERLEPCPETGAMVLSMAHYFTQEGDLCQDPEMTVRIFPPEGDRKGCLEASTFEQAIPPIYQEVYPAPGKVAPALKRQLNEFLSLWLRNLKEQGHRLIENDDPSKERLSC